MTTYYVTTTVNIMKPIKEKMTKSQLLAYMAEGAGTDRKTAAACLAAMEEAMARCLAPGGVGEFTVPNVVKIKTRHVAAVKGGKKATNPFTGEEYVTKNKPATTKVRAVPHAYAKYAAVGEYF